MAKKKENVDEFMSALDHPLKAEIQAIRDIIKGVNENITEEFKWKAPSYSYKDYIATFNLRTNEHVHLVFHNPAIATIQNRILEGNYVDRRMAYFTDMADVKDKEADIVFVVQELIKAMDQ